MSDILVDLEIALVKAFGWSLHDIDKTDIESLFPFINRVSQSSRRQEYIYADKADWI